MNANTLLKSFNEAIEEVESAVVDDDDLEKSEDEISDDDVLDDGETLDVNDEDSIIQKAKDILKGRKMRKKKKMTDDDYTDDEIDDDDDEDDDDDMDKAKDGNLPMEGDRDAKVMEAGRGMKTIIYMRKSVDRQNTVIEAQNELIKSLVGEVDTLKEAMVSNLTLTKKVGELVIGGVEMQKSVKDEIKEIGDQPVRSAATKRKPRQEADFRNPTNDVERSELLRKSIESVREHELPDHLVTMLEGRLGAQKFNPDINLWTDELSHLKQFLDSDANKRS